MNKTQEEIAVTGEETHAYASHICSTTHEKLALETYIEFTNEYMTFDKMAEHKFPLEDAGYIKGGTCEAIKHLHYIGERIFSEARKSLIESPRLLFKLRARHWDISTYYRLFPSDEKVTEALNIGLDVFTYTTEGWLAFTAECKLEEGAIYGFKGL